MTTTLNEDDLLRRLAERVMDEPGWLGHTLLEYAERHGHATIALATDAMRPGRPIRGRELSRLMLCRTPASPAQMAEVAGEFGLDTGVLARVVGVAMAQPDQPQVPPSLRPPSP